VLRRGRRAKIFDGRCRRTGIAALAMRDAACEQKIVDGAERAVRADHGARRSRRAAQHSDMPCATHDATMARSRRDARAVR
jgi:hypothetical protein